MAVSEGTLISGRAVGKTFTEETVRIAYQKGTQLSGVPEACDATKKIILCRLTNPSSRTISGSRTK